MMTIDDYLSMKKDIDSFEEQVKTAVLMINGKKPSNFELGFLRLSSHNGNFNLHNNELVYSASFDEVMKFVGTLPQFATVKHIPKTAADIQVGDIYFCSWGATMLLANFYKVVKRTKCFVTLRELDTVEKGDDQFTGTSVPLDTFVDSSSVYDDERFVDADGKVYAQRTVKVDPKGSPNLWYKKFMCCRPWDGQPKPYDHCD